MRIKSITDDKQTFTKHENVALTPREMDVLKAMTKGMTDIEIGLILNISRYTVSGHRKQMISKFNAKNSCQLVYLACESGHI